MKHYGLIGTSLSHSFSKKYFTQKFRDSGIQADYKNFESQDLQALLKTLGAELDGFNVTIPYKEAIIPFLDELSPAAKAINAVNVVKVDDGKLLGFNTDYSAFLTSIKAHLPKESSALIFGSGGASKAIQFALKQSGIPYELVSRWSKKLCYSDLTADTIAANQLLINTTPIGTFPEINKAIRIPYAGISASHLAYDLVYNPEESKFLRIARKQGAKTLNGLAMLELQAEESWSIWNQP